MPEWNGMKIDISIPYMTHFLKTYIQYNNIVELQ